MGGRLLAAGLVAAWSLAAGALAGCDDRPAPAPGPSAPGDGVSGGGPGGDESGGGASAGLPSGLVWIGLDPRAKPAIMVFDPKTGAALHSSALPLSPSLSLPPPPSKDRFNADRTMFLTVNDCKIVVLRWERTAFVMHGTWEPPTSFSGGRECYDDAWFEAGRIRATIKLPGGDPAKVVSLDPAAPGSAPRDEGAVRPVREVRLTVAGVSDGRSFANTDGKRVVRLTVDTPLQASRYYEYRCELRVDDATRVCVDRVNADQPFGAVAVATVDLAAKTVTLRQVTPKTTRRIAQVFLSPDGKEILIRNSGGYYRASLAGNGGEPVEAFKTLPIEPNQVAHPQEWEWI